MSTGRLLMLKGHYPASQTKTKRDVEQEKRARLLKLQPKSLFHPYLQHPLFRDIKCPPVFKKPIKFDWGVENRRLLKVLGRYTPSYNIQDVLRAQKYGYPKEHIPRVRRITPIQTKENNEPSTSEENVQPSTSEVKIEPTAFYDETDVSEEIVILTAADDKMLQPAQPARRNTPGQ